MKVFKAIFYAILLLVWVVATIFFIVTVFPIVLIAISGLEEWFEFANTIFYELKSL